MTNSGLQSGQVLAVFDALPAESPVEARTRLLEEALAENKRLNASLTARNNLLDAFMNNGPFLTFIKSAEGRMLFYNSKMLRKFSIEGDAWIGKTDHELWPAEMADEFRRNDLAVLAGGVPVTVDEQSPGAEPGSVAHWRSYKFPITGEDGTPMLAGISIDRTEEIERTLRLESALRAANELSKSLDRSHALFRTFLDNNPNHCYLKTPDGRYVFYNRRFADHFGIDKRKWIGLTDFDIVPRALAEEARAHDLEALESDRMVERMGELADAAGNRCSFKLIRFRCTDEAGNAMLAGVAVDVTGELHRQRTLAEDNRKLTEMAASDALTGLSNRRTIDTRLPIAFEDAGRCGAPLSVLMLDLDNFKLINDTYGHAAGDHVLRSVGQVLLHCCRPGNVVGRIGGEEFAFLLPEFGPEQAMRFAEHLLCSIRAMPPWPCPITASIGISTTNATTMTAERLLRRADDAMYAAKRAGKNRVVAHQLHLEALMREASRQHKAAASQA